MAQPMVMEGKASYYADYFKGRKTASGEKYDPAQLTAAHRTLPFGTFVKVTNEKNQKSVIVKVNDRGPFARGRIIDLSRKAAEEIGMVAAGVTSVTVSIMDSASLSAPDTAAVAQEMPAVAPAPVFFDLDMVNVNPSGWCVVVGEFTSEQEMMTTGKNIRNEYNVSLAIMPVQRNGSRRYRLYAGEFEREESAAILLESLLPTWPGAASARYDQSAE